MTDGPAVERITDRQREVARLIHLGRTNREIARELGVSLDGAKYHVSELLGRLGVDRREDIGSWYATDRSNFIRERLRWLLSPLGAAGAGVAAVATVAVVIVGVAVIRADGSSTGDRPVSGAVLLSTPAGTMHDPARLSHDATRLSDGRVLVSGGIDPGLDGGELVALRSAEIYDPASDTWARVEDMPFSLIDHTGVLLPDGRVQLIGGLSLDVAGAESQQLWFDPSSETFETRTSDPALDGPLTLRGGGLPSVRRSGTPVAAGGRGRFIGYDVGSGGWVELDTFVRDRQVLGEPSGPMLYGVTALADGQFALSWSDFAADGRTLEDVAGRYDPATETVSEVLRLESGSVGPQVHATTDGGFVILARTGPGDAIEAMYVASGGVVAEPVTYAVSRDGLHEWVELPDGAVEVLSVPVDTWLRLSDTPTMSQLELLPVARAGNAVTRLEDGRLLVTGGLQLTAEARASVAAGELVLPGDLLFTFAPGSAATLEPFEASSARLITLP